MPRRPIENDLHERAIIFTGKIGDKGPECLVDQFGDEVEITVGALVTRYSMEELAKIGTEKYGFAGGIGKVIGSLATMSQKTEETWHRPFDDELRASSETE